MGISFGSRIVAKTLEPVQPGNFKSSSELRDEVQKRIDRALQ
jgi:hypothetical protein